MDRIDKMENLGNTIKDSIQINMPIHLDRILGPVVYLVLSVLITIIVLVVIWAQSYNYYTPENLIIHTNSFLKKWEAVYGAAANGRKSLNEYLTTLTNEKKIQPNQKCLGNFYIMTANAAATGVSPDGVLLPGLPICNIEALSFLLRAGCRGFIFDVHEPLSDRGKPFISILDANPNKKWRTTSMNSLPFRDPINRLRAEAFGEGSLGQTQIVQIKNTTDPIFIYLRFNRLHKPEFYNAVAADLENAFKDYRLDYTWAAGRRETDFYTTDIQEFMGKVVIICNQKAAGSVLEDFINITPVSSVKANYSTADVQNITADEIMKVKPIIQQHLCAAFDVPGTPEAIKNTLDWKRAQDLGIQMVGLNFFSDAGNLNGYRETFGLYSFKVKPEALRYSVKLSNAPRRAGQESNMNGGNITVPELQLRT